MKNKLGILSVVLGAALLVSALLLFLFNNFDAKRAQRASEEILASLLSYIVSDDGIQINPYDTVMKDVEINGIGYVGYLSIPALDLALPVAAECDNNTMKDSVCRYSGSVNECNMVIAGHNYSRHFGKLPKLKTGDKVMFTDIGGKTSAYAVYELETLPPAAVDEMTAGEADLTLFTCTYSGQARFTVRCELQNSEQSDN
ncbi:MAG: sortase [Clostridiales bacterium]|nr:sortase [Clostridiales bacterium]